MRKAQKKRDKNTQSRLQWKTEFIRAGPQIRDKPWLTRVLGNMIRTELLPKQRHIYGLKHSEQRNPVKTKKRKKHLEIGSQT